MMFEPFDVIVVGAGFFGATIAERIATVVGRPVAVIEKRDHIGGNAYSEIDRETGIEVHKYGSHIFHTNSPLVWNYITRFTEFNDYRHRVFTCHNGCIYSLPINLMTICSYFKRAFNPDSAREYILTEAASQPYPNPANLEEKAISLIGPNLYKAFIRGYTAKQWQTDPRELPPEIITRLPVRYSFNDRYFSDKYEGIPIDGYAAVFNKMLRHPLIGVFLKVDFFDVWSCLGDNKLVIYTGPIDKFFNYRCGTLTWRTLDFEREVIPTTDFQGTSVMNYADLDIPWTRVHEFSHFHPERHYKMDAGTVIFREYSRFAGLLDEPYYPIGTAGDKRIYAAYSNLSRSTENCIFGGRLGTYRYLDMHQAIGAALRAFEHDVMPRLTGGAVDQDGVNVGQCSAGAPAALAVEQQVSTRLQRSEVQS
jgi:UDP-galactopyranose mutase